MLAAMSTHLHRVWTWAWLGAVLAAIGLTLAGCDTKITQANYDKVTVGMTLGEVQRLLGSGTLDAQPGGVNISAGGVGDAAKGSTDQTYTWRDGPAEIVITFADGKVVQKRASGL
jgi:hypothetical protein